MANPETSIIDGKYIAAWGGIQSAGQTVGQIVLHHLCLVLTVLIVVQLLQYATDGYGRKIALYIIFLTFVIVCHPYPSFWPSLLTVVRLERLHRVLRDTLGSLAGGKTVLRYGRWHAAVHYAPIPIRDFTHAASWLSHQRV